MFTLLSAVVGGGLMYYLQVYAFYEELPVHEQSVSLTNLGESVEPILFDDFQGIDAESSPLRYRACFTTSHSQAMLTETYIPYENPEPRIAPDWFDCFDAAAIGAALENGTALAFLGQKDVIWGFDRVVAITDDGRGYVWHEMNHCGEEVFDGKPLPEGCPPRPNNASESN